MRTTTKLRLGARTVVVLSRVEIGLRTASLAELCRSLGIALTDRESPAVPAGFAPGSNQRISEVLRAVDVLASRWPFGDTCLRRAMVITILLRPFGPQLRIGVRRGTDGVIKAHAWVEIQGRSIDPESGGYEAMTPR